MKNILKNRLSEKFFGTVKNIQFIGLNFPLLLALSLIISSCELDNLAPPDGHISGVIIDSVTRQPLLTEQPEGVDVHCNELIGPGGDGVGGGQGFTGRADGTFNNTKVFAGYYNVDVKGPFHTPPVQAVEIRSNQTSEVNFTVVPYVSFAEVSIEKDPNEAGTVMITFRLSTHESFGKTASIRSCRLFASSRTRHVGMNAFDDAVSSGDISLTADKLNNVIVIRQGGFVAGKTYYLRIGARCIESYQGRYNMTAIKEMKF